LIKKNTLNIDVVKLIVSITNTTTENIAKPATQTCKESLKKTLIEIINIELELMTKEIRSLVSGFYGNMFIGLE